MSASSAYKQAARAVVALVAAVSALCLAPRAARADVVTLLNNALAVRQPGPNSIDAGKSNNVLLTHALPYGMNFDDCQKDIQYVFGVQVDNVADTLQVWAAPSGVDCTDPTMRAAGSAGACWPVTQALTNTATSFTVIVNGRDIALHVGGDEGVVGQYSYTAGTIAACSKQNTPAAIPLTLSFLLFNGGTFITGETPAQYALTFDTLGPPSPCLGSSGVMLDPNQVNGAIGIGDGELIPQWTPPLSSDLYGMRVFCTPRPASAGAPPTLDLTVAPVAAGADNTQCGLADDTDAGSTTTTPTTTATTTAGYAPGLLGTPFDSDAGDDADVDAGTVVTDTDAAAVDSAVPLAPSAEQNSQACGTSLIDGMNGELIPSYYECGDYTGTSITQATVTGLTNYTTYSFAAAATDQMGNAGPIVFLGCTYPSPILNFYNAYADAGGLAGGGYCSTPSLRGTDQTVPVGTTLLGLGVLGVGVAGVRRRSRRRKK